MNLITNTMTREKITKIEAGIITVEFSNHKVKYTSDYYEHRDAAVKAAEAKKSSWGPNLVILGIEEKIVEGVRMYYPEFNIWD